MLPNEAFGTRAVFRHATKSFRRPTLRLYCSWTLPKTAITDLKAWPIRQPADGRAYVVVRVETDTGLVGWGEASPGTDPVAAARTLDSAKADLVGQDAVSAEAVHLRLGKADIAAAQAPVNMALLDILGKLCKAPVYEVLGGPTRSKARALTRLLGATEAEWTESLKQVRAAGFRAAIVPLSIPEGPVRGRGFYRRVRETLERLRQAGGEEVDFVLDCGRRATAGEAALLAGELERFHLLWLEAPALGPRALAEIAAESATPVGHERSTVADFQELFRDDAVDAIRPDIAVWGVSALRKAAALAETYYVAVAPHHRGGPIGTAAALHVAASIPNFFAQEVPFAADERDRRMREEIAGAALEKVADGWLSLPSGPGLGVTVDPQALDRYRIR